MEIERSILHWTKTSIQQCHAVLLQFDGKCYWNTESFNWLSVGNLLFLFPLTWCDCCASFVLSSFANLFLYVLCSYFWFSKSVYLISNCVLTQFSKIDKRVGWLPDELFVIDQLFCHCVSFILMFTDNWVPLYCFGLIDESYETIHQSVLFACYCLR